MMMAVIPSSINRVPKIHTGEKWRLSPKWTSLKDSECQSLPSRKGCRFLGCPESILIVLRLPFLGCYSRPNNLKLEKCKKE
jgi:hypothetical protein